MYYERLEYAEREIEYCVYEYWEPNHEPKSMTSACLELCLFMISTMAALAE